MVHSLANSSKISLLSITNLIVLVLIDSLLDTILLSIEVLGVMLSLISLSIGVDLSIVAPNMLLMLLTSTITEFRLLDALSLH
jgi:hypothetical protein